MPNAILFQALAAHCPAERAVACGWAPKTKHIRQRLRINHTFFFPSFNCISADLYCTRRTEKIPIIKFAGTFLTELEVDQDPGPEQEAA